ncbi:DUF1659 domain-containing protein [Aneurinibacillus migulanus]|uniref:DUF1659 domain-containing protein n=1 Tax=Aneurinibacillus migulanus TaxID=47500 RepID=A0A0D1UY92_ANEMI|nr:DUF1659 domain-containing protein [Aneurinibacillus migulanus]KIV52034.1 hypothetical protein TS65_26245 [Aneurinibacillus migulanus]KON98168.1 hypothetical protein AF333_24725 [Aneurinibacillus migulanus]MED0891454.1 DUF1659 domain-containing protein [Aneurinibacillus migulanus]MED1613857.1 DUF1659 domain-containing protein [Aneurinibacillus migulanus]SDI06741.1 Protein of unknown function [Aneurinibacillus migulanus]
MAVTGTVSSVQMVLLFQDGVDGKGNVKLAKKVYKNVAKTAKPEDVYEVAEALADLQMLSLAGVQHIIANDLAE